MYTAVDAFKNHLKEKFLETKETPEKPPKRHPGSRRHRGAHLDAPAAESRHLSCLDDDLGGGAFAWGGALGSCRFCRFCGVQGFLLGFCWAFGDLP